MKRTFAILSVAALLALGWVLGTGVSASAHTPTAAVSCSQANVSLVSYDSGATANVTLDGTVKHTGTFGGHYVQTWPLTATVNHTLVVHVVSKDGSKYNFDFNQTTTGCVPVKPPQPQPIVVVTNHSTTDCDAKTVTEYTDTTTTNWTYNDNTNTWDKGTPTTVETSQSRPATEQECPTSTPTPTPTVTPPPVTHTTPPKVGTPNPVNNLALTGTSEEQHAAEVRTERTEGFTGFGIVILGLGAILLGVHRRRKLNENG